MLNNLKEFTFQCSLVLHFSHTLPLSPPQFPLTERTDHSPSLGKEVGRREEGENHRDMIGGRFIDIPLRIYSLRILFILFMFINHTLPSTMKSPKSPEGYLVFSVIWQREQRKKMNRK